MPSSKHFTRHNKLLLLDSQWIPSIYHLALLITQLINIFVILSTFDKQISKLYELSN